jgi:hypothetical protein
MIHNHCAPLLADALSAHQAHLGIMTDDSTLDTGEKVMNAKTKTTVAEYFGLKVEVLSMMEHCALIRFGERECVVDTADLLFVWQSRRAA